MVSETWSISSSDYTTYISRGTHYPDEPKKPSPGSPPWSLYPRAGSTGTGEAAVRIHGSRHCIGVSSGTDALLMALMAWNIGPGDAVFTTPFTFIATAEVIQLLGATPVFVDIDPKTFNIDPDKLELAIQALQAGDPSIYPLPRASGLKPRAIIPVDLFGLPSDYDAIMELAQRYDLKVLSDSAQGFGSEYKGMKSAIPGRP